MGLSRFRELHIPKKRFARKSAQFFNKHHKQTFMAVYKMPGGHGGQTVFQRKTLGAIPRRPGPVRRSGLWNAAAIHGGRSKGCYGERADFQHPSGAADFGVLYRQQNRMDAESTGKATGHADHHGVPAGVYSDCPAVPDSGPRAKKLSGWPPADAAGYFHSEPVGSAPLGPAGAGTPQRHRSGDDQPQCPVGAGYLLFGQGGNAPLHRLQYPDWQPRPRLCHQLRQSDYGEPQRRGNRQLLPVDGARGSAADGTHHHELGADAEGAGGGQDQGLCHGRRRDRDGADLLRRSGLRHEPKGCCGGQRVRAGVPDAGGAGANDPEVRKAAAAVSRLLGYTDTR